MKKYRIKPGEIEAAQYTGPTSKLPGVNVREVDGEFLMAYVKTPKGAVVLNIGDWIIKIKENEFFVCKPEVFDKVYELVEEV